MSYEPLIALSAAETFSVMNLRCFEATWLAENPNLGLFYLFINPH